MIRMKQAPGPKSPGSRSPSRHEYYKRQAEALRNQRRYDKKHPKPAKGRKKK